MAKPSRILGAHRLKILSTLLIFLSCLSGLSLAHAQGTSFGERLSDAALDRTNYTVRYDGRYLSIPYPGGDVPGNIGVCTDVVIRSYRALGIDLQKNVHEDMKAYFGQYPKDWGLSRTDTNIDHRRVPNLETFFERHGQSFGPSTNPADFEPGDLVTWRLNGSNLPHIGVVTYKKSSRGVPLIVHNIGAGPRLEDILFDHKMIGHYRYNP